MPALRGGRLEEECRWLLFQTAGGSFVIFQNTKGWGISYLHCFPGAQGSGQVKHYHYLSLHIPLPIGEYFHWRLVYSNSISLCHLKQI